MFWLNLRQRQNLTCTNNRRIHPRFHCEVQKHRVQHYSRCWVQAEGNIRDAQNDMTSWKFFPNAANRFNRGFTICPVFFDTRGDGEGESVKENFVRWNAVFYSLAIGALCDRKFLFCRSRHPLSINRANYYTRTVLLR